MRLRHLKKSHLPSQLQEDLAAITDRDKAGLPFCPKYDLFSPSPIPPGAWAVYLPFNWEERRNLSLASSLLPRFCMSR